MSNSGIEDWLLPGLPAARIRECYERAAGNELQSGKFGSPESSAALAANAFGYFLDRPQALPPLPGADNLSWPASSLQLEACMRFPWRGGRHPYLDVGIETPAELIGIESKRIEPFRDKHSVDFSAAYWRPVWGGRMRRFEAVRDGLNDGRIVYRHLGACQLVKHAFGLRSEIMRKGSRSRPILFYLFAESHWAESTGLISTASHRLHRDEIADFAHRVRGDEVDFFWCSYAELLASWRKASFDLAAHADAIELRFAPA